ncbi:hypothetical protein EDD80_11463 [Anseongella ginsenosidimutans]|uniref:Uncharacterized protein n=1 Tax=Anseongella ginsenosidimutans TaxID=496056 RepID=A0A4R3KM94_9SPHI|nr:hypothetical protein EDD80_11463 [Anseongella ginsenosidimutans]
MPMIWGVASSSTALFILVSPSARMVFFCFSLLSITLLICVILIFAMLVAYLSVKYFIQVYSPLICYSKRVAKLAKRINGSLYYVVRIG